jgi:hypothetical protein
MVNRGIVQDSGGVQVNHQRVKYLQSIQFVRFHPREILDEQKLGGNYFAGLQLGAAGSGRNAVDALQENTLPLIVLNVEK